MPQEITIDTPTTTRIRIGDGDRVVVGRTGSITTEDQAVIALDNQHENYVLVAGHITSTENTAVVLNSGCEINVITNGSIFGHTGGISIGSMSFNEFIMNSGSIGSVTGSAISGTDNLSISNDETGVIASESGCGINFTNGSLDNRLYLLNEGVVKGHTGISSSRSNDYVGNTGTIQGTGGHAILFGDGDDTYEGRTGTVLGIVDMGEGHDAFNGGIGSETIVAGEGNDLIDGGEGEDYLQFETAKNVTVNLADSSAQDTGEGIDTITFIEHLIGGAGNDTFIGSQAANTLMGRAGNDWLDGKGGADRLEGGLGNDTFVVDDSSDLVIELGGQGHDKVVASVSYTLVPDAEVEELHAASGSIGNVTLTGNSGRNTIQGGTGDDHLYGSGGDDVLIDLMGGSDSFDGGSGDKDIVSYEEASGGQGIEVYMHGHKANRGAAAGDTYVRVEVINATNHDDTLEGNEDNNGFWGADGRDEIKGFGGNDTLAAGGGNDVLDGGSGNDELYGDEGNDFLYGSGGGEDKFHGGAGTDTVSYFGADEGVGVYLGDLAYNHGAAENDSYDQIEVIDGTDHDDTLEGADGNDAFWAADGADALNGHLGDDTLSGGDGNDRLEGGDGTDALHGGDGNDTYIVDAADIIFETSGQGTDTVIATASFSLAAGVDVEILKASADADVASINLTGNEIGNELHGNGDANRIDGGRGTDTVVLTGRRTDYTVRLNQDGSVTLADKRADGDGSDTIRNVEIFQFADSKMGLVSLVGGAENLLTGDVVAENTAAGTEIGAFAASNKAGGPFRYELLADAQGRFQIDAASGKLKVANGVKLDYEQAAQHTITVRMTDASGAATDKNFTILVQDVFNERAFGSAEADVMKGGAGQDYFAAMAGNDRIESGLGHDTLSGGQGNDTLVGGGGKDMLTGNAGKDVFVFDTKPNKSTNLDRIGDFNVRDDAFFLDNAVFGKLGSGSDARPKKFKADMFVKGAKAQDAEDRIVYDKKTGSLYYDADGTGSAAQVKIATLTKNLKMTHSDFFVI